MKPSLRFFISEIKVFLHYAIQLHLQSADIHLDDLDLSIPKYSQGATREVSYEIFNLPLYTCFDYYEVSVFQTCPTELCVTLIID